MRIRYGLCLALLVSASACGGSPSPAKPSASATMAPAPSFSMPGLVHPNGRQQRAFLRELATAAPTLASDNEQAIRRGRDVCLDLAGDGRKVAVSHLRKAADLDAAAAGRVVDAARRNFCPKA